MQLIIKNNHNIEITKFTKFLIQEIQKYFIQHLDKIQLNRFDIYLEKNKDRFTKELKRHFKAYDLLITTIYNLSVEKQGKDAVIRLDSNQIIPFTSLTIDKFARLINDGNQSIAGYPIFDSVFKYFAQHLEEYYTVFTLRGK